MTTADKTPNSNNSQTPDSLDDYDTRHEDLLKSNEKLLGEFERWLRGKGLAESTIVEHFTNASFFLNIYLLRDLLDAKEGIYEFDSFFGDFFIHECVWSTPATLKRATISLKKLYRCMEDAELISPAAYRIVLDEVKENLSEWQERCEAYNSGEPLDYLEDNLDNPFLGLDDLDFFDDLDSSDDLDDYDDYGELILPRYSELLAPAVMDIVSSSDNESERPSLPLVDQSYLDDLSKEVIEDIEADLTILLLYVMSRKNNVSGDRISQLTFPKKALEKLKSRREISISGKGQKVTLHKEAHMNAELLLAAYLDLQENISKAAEDVVSNIIGANKGLDYLNEDGTCRVFYFRIELELGKDLVCWRELAIPAHFSFDLFHQAIQAAFLWWDYHLYDFKLRTCGKDMFIANPSKGGIDAMFSPSNTRLTHKDSTEIALDEVFPQTRTATYSYDYGDGWEHKITLIETIENSPITVPTCIDGQGDAPPEDVGGPGGFGHFLEVIGDENHPDYERMKKWAWGQFYEPYSLAAVNNRLDRWPTGELFDEWKERNS